MEKRKNLTIQDVFQKDIYKNMIYLIDRYSGEIEFKHLRYALVKKNDLSNKEIDKIKIFFNPNREIVKLTEKKIKNSKLKDETKQEIIKKINRSSLDSSFFKNNVKLSTKQNLYNHLDKIKKLGLIYSYKKKKKHPCYFITRKGHIYFIRYMIKNNFDNFFPDSKLDTLIICILALEKGKKIIVID